MHDDEYTRDERRLLDALPRESTPSQAEEERLVARLRAEGFLRRRWRYGAGLAAAAAALVIGMFIGSQLADARSLEAQLARERLSPADANALLERAREAYERARDRYTVLVGATPATSPERTDVQPVRTTGVLWF